MEVEVVYRDDPASSPFQRFMNRSWPLFRAFGVDVRVHWLIVLMPLVLLAILRRQQYDWSQAWALAGALTVGIYVSVWVHEMGHIVVGRRLGAPSRQITLSPLGGLAHFEAPMPNARAEILTAAAGPLTQLAFALALAVPYVLSGAAANAADGGVQIAVWSSAYRAFLVFQIVMVGFNLLPFFPFDGGRVLRGFLSQRMNASKASLVTAQAGFGGAIFLALAGLAILIQWGGEEQRFGIGGATTGAFLVLFGVTNFLASRQLQREAKHVDSPYEPVEAWKAGRGEEPWKDSIAESERLSRAEERRERRAAEARRQEDLHRRKLKERIDQLLDRINEVGGVDRLTPAERRELAEASEHLRREPAER